MEEIAYWYKNEVERWRVGASIAWGQLLLPASVFATVVAANVDIFHPIEWVINSLIILQPSSWTYLVVLAVMIGILSTWQAKHYSVSPQVLSTRLAYIWNILSPAHLFFTVGHALCTGAATWCVVNLIGGRYQGLSRFCDGEGPPHCVNEQHLFVVLHGAMIGAVYAINFFLAPNNVMTFPIIQQSKFFHIKTQLFAIIQTCILQVLSQLRYYFVAYYFILGPGVTGWIGRNLRLNQSSVGMVESLYSLMDVGMLWCTLMSGTLIQFMMTLAQRLYNTYQTEPYHFPIESSFEEDNRRTLAKALTCTQLPILQYLGYQDLSALSHQSPVRRAELYSLSQPGGHPNNWTAVSSACLNLLRDVTNRMADFNNTCLGTGPTRQLSGDKKAGSGLLSTPNPVSRTNSSFTNGSFNGSMVTNLSFRGPPMSSTHPASATITEENPKPTAVPVTTKIMNHLKKRKAVAFFFGDLPDAPSKRLYADCQMYIWAVEAISQLACASYDEDKFGVVQKSLPDIISTLLSLQEAVEKQLKLAPNTNRRGVKGSPAATDTTQRHALRACIKTGLYRIVNTFNTHLMSISLSGEHMRRLRLFMDYKE